jgi:hypothetical protein
MRIPYTKEPAVDDVRFLTTIEGLEWRWAIIWSGIILLITSLPYLYGALLATPELHFSGFIIGVEDGNSYLAKMREGWEGHWLFYLAYTPEPHRGAFFFAYYLLLGKLARLLGLNLLLVLHLSRILTIPAGLVSFYCFAAYVTSDLTVRRIAFLLFGLTAGLGWLWALLGLPAMLGLMPVDLWVPDASFFLAALTFPHLPLAQGLLLWIVIASLIFLHSGDRGWGVIAAGAGLIVSLIHPYTLPVFSTILGLYLLYRAYHEQNNLWLGIKRLFLITLPSAPYLVYVLVVFETNFAFRVWRDQSITLSPLPIHYILGFGLILGLVAVGFWQSDRYFLRHALFLKIWILAVPILLYIPIALQRRFLDGYQAPLALLGAIGLVALTSRFQTDRPRMVVTMLALLVMSLTNLLLLMGGLVIVDGRQTPIFFAASHQAAFDWLSENAQDQTILAAYDTGNLLPAHAPLRVFLGHGPETAYSETKRALIARFFASNDEAFRRQLLQEYAITYLYYGPAERVLGDFRPDDSPYLQKVYDNGTVQIYRVNNKING